MPEPQQAERPGQQHPGHQGRPGGTIGVGQLAGQVGGENPGGAHQAEEADHGARVVVRGTGEQEGDGGPEHAETGERARPVPRPPAQDRLVDQQAERRAHQIPVARCGRGPSAGSALHKMAAKTTMSAAENQ